jgi:parallel beta-helix repeat protein
MVINRPSSWRTCIGGNSAVGDQADGTLRYFRNLSPPATASASRSPVAQHRAQRCRAEQPGVGFQIDGSSNFVTDTRVYTSTLNGVQVNGDSNQLLKIWGGRQEQRARAGSSNLLQENTSRSNTLDGFHIVTGTNNTLTKNTAGGTASQNNLGPCQYDIPAGNIDGGGNKSKGVSVAVPAGCTN